MTAKQEQGHLISRVERAMRLPQFRNVDNVEDYELDEDGVPVRKDRFVTLCRSLAVSLYPRGKWSFTALKEHVRTLVYFVMSFGESRQSELYAAPESREIEFYCHSEKIKIKPLSWLTEHCIENELFNMLDSKGVNIHVAHDCHVDVILTDGSMISNALLVCPKLKKHEVVSPADIVWKGLSLKDDVDRICLKTNKQAENTPFFTRFTRENLEIDNERCLESERILGIGSDSQPIKLSVQGD